jgi:hypothetical protein
VLLEPGTAISVQVGRHWRSCLVDSANEEWLSCSMDLAPVLTGRNLMYRREEVIRVRFENRAASRLAGALIGTGLGFGFGAIRGGGGTSGTTRGGSEFIGSMLGALVGGVIGRPTVHGRLIYERPVKGRAAGSPKP